MTRVVCGPDRIVRIFDADGTVLRYGTVADLAAFNGGYPAGCIGAVAAARDPIPDLPAPDLTGKPRWLSKCSVATQRALLAAGAV